MTEQGICTESVCKLLIVDNGLFRNVQFQDPDWTGINNLFAWIKNNYKLNKVSDSYHLLKKKDFRITVDLQTLFDNFNIMLWFSFKRSQHVLKELQFVVTKVDHRSVSAEILFHPEDLDLKAYSSQDLLDFVQHSHQLINTRDYNIRYEDDENEFDPFYYQHTP